MRIERRFIGSERIGKQKTKRYRTTKTITFREGQSEWKRLVSDEYWFGSNGMMVRESHEDVLGKNKRYKPVTDCEYDEGVRIVAPNPKRLEIPVSAGRGTSPRRDRNQISCV